MALFLSDQAGFPMAKPPAPNAPPHPAPACRPRVRAAGDALVDDDRNILTTVSIASRRKALLPGSIRISGTALKALLENPPDLAVCDIKMPRMDGFELLRQLRAKSALPVIFLTSKDEEPDEALGLALGADDYIAQAVRGAGSGGPHPRDPAAQRLRPRRCRRSTERTAARADPPRAADDGSAPPRGDLGRRARFPDRHRIPDSGGAGQPPRA